MRARFFLLLVLVAASAQATDPFIARIADATAALKEHDYKKALKIDERVIDDMLGFLGPGETETKWFSVAVAQKAIALAGLGREDDAIWYWHVALNLYPAVEKGDMSAFGAPAEFLRKHPLEPFADVPKLPSPKPPNATYPVPSKRVEPRYPGGARASGASGIVILESVIDKNGIVRNVELKRANPAVTLSFAAMEALRRWTFQPATIDGKPVDVRFNLTINFKP
jgi:TonB family protein